MSAASSPSVIVGISGGVDSAVAALLLKRAGYRVRGLFMKNWNDDDGTEYCTARDDLMDADRVCAHLGIDLETANFAAEYRDNVFAHFLTEYAAGRTPNPDILCNREIKFKEFVDHAAQLGADLIATGHYARGCWLNGLEPAEALCADPQAADFRLLKGVDAGKDQTYFLQAVPRPQLARCLFPLGGLRKREVREMARREGLHNHRRKDSTGICFIGERRFRDFLQRYLPVQPGPIVDTAGHALGEHQGLAYYTLGQRQGLGIGGVKGQAEAPWYVMAKDLASNTLIVTQHEGDLDSDWLVARDPNWLAPTPSGPFDCTIRVRYRQTDQGATVHARTDGSVRVDFHAPQRAVTPGQYVAFYRDDVCLGGGLIETTGRGAAP
jgi:tRNA-specific 2-thiouridylase